MRMNALFRIAHSASGHFLLLPSHPLAHRAREGAFGSPIAPVIRVVEAESRKFFTDGFDISSLAITSLHMRWPGVSPRRVQVMGTPNHVFPENDTIGDPPAR